MARSLARNTRVWATTLTLAEWENGDNDAQNTFEIKVLDGYSFSQDVATQEIGVNEADSACPGSGIARGTLAFNTALNPVDVSFSTYVRPVSNTLTVNGSVSDSADCVERVLWASAMGNSDSWDEVTLNGAAPTEVIYAQSATQIDFGLGQSNFNELQDLTLFFVLQNATYVIEDFSVGTAEVDFSIDGIATINWSGNGSIVRENPSIHEDLKDGGIIEANAGGLQYQAVPPTTADSFLRNKLSTLELTNNQIEGTPAITGDTLGTVAFPTITPTTPGMTISEHKDGRLYNSTLDEWAIIVDNDETTITLAPGDESVVTDTTTPWVAGNSYVVYNEDQHANITYCVPITGATLTLENNFTYLTPEELATVNLPLAGFAGNRVTSGSFTAYLNTGAMGTGGLLQDLLGKIQDSVTTDYALTFHMGNPTGSFPRVDFDVPSAQISIPSTNVEDIISTEISFTAVGIASGEQSFEATNEITISYFDKPVV